MKNERLLRVGSATLAVMVGLSASGARAHGVEDSPPPPASTVAAPAQKPARISFYDGAPLLGGKALEGDAFYRLVGRPDLAEHHRRRQGRKSTVVGASLFVGSLGLIWGLGNVLFTQVRVYASPRGSLNPYPWLVVGAALTTVAVATAIPADPIDFHQRVELARAYNSGVRLIPTVHAGGGGLTLAGSF